MISPWELVISKAKNSTTVVIVAPYIKEGSLQTLLEIFPKIISLTCVTRWRPDELRVGVSDASVREIIVQRGGSFYLHPRLHAKYYRFDDEVLVGSANLTGSGFGLVPNANLEILSPPSSSFNPKEFEHTLFSKCRIITDSEYAIWSSIPVTAQSSAVISEPMASEWRPMTRDPKDLWFVYSQNRRDSLPEKILEQIDLDLSAISAPPSLDHSTFSTWVSSALLASPFVSDVLNIPDDAEPAVFIRLGRSWGMSPGDARYAAETVYNWKRYYALGK